MKNKSRNRRSACKSKYQKPTATDDDIRELSEEIMETWWKKKQYDFAKGGHAGPRVRPYQTKILSNC